MPHVDHGLFYWNTTSVFDKTKSDAKTFNTVHNPCYIHSVTRDSKKVFLFTISVLLQKNVMFNYLYYFDIDYCVIICESCLQFTSEFLVFTFFLPFLCRYYKTDYDKKFWRGAFENEMHIWNLKSATLLEKSLWLEELTILLWGRIVYSDLLIWINIK